MNGDVQNFWRAMDIWHQKMRSIPCRGWAQRMENLQAAYRLEVHILYPILEFHIPHVGIYTNSQHLGTPYHWFVRKVLSFSTTFIHLAASLKLAMLLCFQSWSSIIIRLSPNAAALPNRHFHDYDDVAPTKLHSALSSICRVGTQYHNPDDILRMMVKQFFMFFLVGSPGFPFGLILQRLFLWYSTPVPRPRLPGFLHSPQQDSAPSLTT